MSSSALVDKQNDSQNIVSDPKNIDIKSLANEIEKFVCEASNCELANSDKLKKNSTLRNFNKFENNSEQNKFVAAQASFEIVKHLAPCDPVENVHVEEVNCSLNSTCSNLQSFHDLRLKDNLNNNAKTLEKSYANISNEDQNHDTNSNLISSNNSPVVKNISEYETENVCATNCSDKVDSAIKEKLTNISEKCYILKENTKISCEFSKYPLTIIEKSEKQKNKPKKSVKEIIDSINRSQQLLKESAQKGAPYFCAENTIEPICRNQEIDGIQSNSLKIENNLLSGHDNITKYKISKQIFPYRGSSPTAANLDWNPLPKPKRINDG